MTSFTRDLRYAVRTLLKDKSFTSLPFLLALGIGINSTIYSAMHGMLVRPLPYSDPGGSCHRRELSQGRMDG